MLRHKAVYDYVATKNALEEVSFRYGISKSSILNWLSPVSESSPSLFADAEDNAWSTRFLKEVYPVEVRGIPSDFGRGKCFLKSIREIFPAVPHQVCIIHFQRYVHLFLPRTRRSKYFWRNAVLKGVIKNIIKANDRKESLYWLERLKQLKPFFRASYHALFVHSVLKNYDCLTRYFDNHFLTANTNVVENINRQVQRKMKNMDGFKSEANLKAFMRIWFACFKIRNNTTNRPF